MRICFIGGARYVYPLGETSGKKFQALNVLGEVFVVGFSDDWRARLFVQHARFYLLPKLPVSFLRYVEILAMGTPLVLWLILRHGIRILVAQSPYEGFAAALAKKIAGWFGYRVGLVVESHGDFEETLFMQRRVRFPWIYRSLMRVAAHFSCKRANVVRTISQSTGQQVEKWMPGKPIVQFPAWTDIEAFLQRGKATRDSEQTVLYVGVLTPLKGIHHLVNAFARAAAEFPSAQLFIIGKDENKPYASALIKQIKNLNLEAYVRIMGAIPQSQLAVWMANSSVLVLPSLSEGLGRVIIEAMATGTPVIGSRVGGIPELIEDGVSGFLVSPGDETELADKLRWILNNPNEARMMGKLGRTFVARCFSTESYLKGYKQIFELADPKIEHTEHATATF